uniref:Hexosyltransferase n=1 Tax=Neogobius melanostomus TaxID=47308 RepID=A0A8C6V1F7_9GOBI
MYVNLRRIHKVQVARLLTTGLVLSVVMLCWEDLDHHVVSHMRSYTYRYLVNNYNFLNSSFTLKPDGQRRSMGDFRAGPPFRPYLINQPAKCAGKDDILLLLFVKSSPENGDRRRAIRETWADEAHIRTELDANVKVVFVLGVHPVKEERSSVQKGLEVENMLSEDLIQQDFKDTFHNLTTKLVMQYHWASTYCPKAKFVMSADDDVFVHMPNMVRYLKSVEQARSFWVGHVHRGAPPIRRKESKYYVSSELYPWPSYPDYTSGSGYVVSGDVAVQIHHAMQVLNSSMYIDDVFMGMCAGAIGVSPQDHEYFAGEAKAVTHPCIYARMITSHGHVEDMRTLWAEATDPNVEKLSKGILSHWYCKAVKAALLCLPRRQETYQCKAAFT